MVQSDYNLSVLCSFIFKKHQKNHRVQVDDTLFVRSNKRRTKCLHNSLLCAGLFACHVRYCMQHAFIHTYHSRFIPEGVAEASKILLRDADEF
jgi:uncharacterized membrane protein